MILPHYNAVVDDVWHRSGETIVSIKSVFLANKFGVALYKENLNETSSFFIGCLGLVVTQDDPDHLGIWKFIIDNNTNLVKGFPTNPTKCQYVRDNNIVRKRKKNEIIDINFMTQDMLDAIIKEFGHIL